MESNKILAIISIIIGLIFIIFPIFSANLISILIGAAVLIFGLGLAYTGIIAKDISPAISTVSAIFGIVMIILGLAFIFGTNAIAFLVGLQFYIVGFMLIIASIIGLLGGAEINKAGSIVGCYLVYRCICSKQSNINHHHLRYCINSIRSRWIFTCRWILKCIHHFSFFILTFH